MSNNKVQDWNEFFKLVRKPWVQHNLLGKSYVYTLKEKLFKEFHGNENQQLWFSSWSILSGDCLITLCHPRPIKP